MEASAIGTDPLFDRSGGIARELQTWDMDGGKPSEDSPWRRFSLGRQSARGPLAEGDANHSRPNSDDTHPPATRLPPDRRGGEAESGT